MRTGPTRTALDADWADADSADADADWVEKLSLSIGYSTQGQIIAPDLVICRRRSHAGRSHGGRSDGGRSHGSRSHESRSHSSRSHGGRPSSRYPRG